MNHIQFGITFSERHGREIGNNDVMKPLIGLFDVLEFTDISAIRLRYLLCLGTFIIKPGNRREQEDTDG
jgi:hypothetical protein